MSPLDSSTIIANFLKAFEASNKKPCPYSIEYEKGWFVFRHGFVKARYRKAKLLEMTERLNARAAAE